MSNLAQNDRDMDILLSTPEVRLPRPHGAIEHTAEKLDTFISVGYENAIMPRAVYHVHIGKKRTTVILAPALSELLTFKLGHEPQTPAGHQAVREWLQAEINRDPGAVRYGRASQRLAQVAILTIGAHHLVTKREQWLASQLG